MSVAALATALVWTYAITLAVTWVTAAATAATAATIMIHAWTPCWLAQIPAAMPDGHAALAIT